MKLNLFWLILLAGTALGASTVSGRVGVLAMPPMIFLLLRYMVAIVGFGLLFLLYKKPSLPNRNLSWWNMIIVGLGTVVSQLLFAYASRHLSSGIVSLFVALIPLFTAFLAPYFASEKITTRALFGLLLAFTGILLILFTRTTGLTTESTPLWSYIQGLGGAVIYAFAGVYMRRTLKEEDSSLVTFIQMATAAAVLLPMVLTLNQFQLASISWEGWASVLFSGLVGSLVGFWLITFITKTYGATQGALQTYVAPIVATLLGIIILKERTSVFFIVSLGLVLTGLLVASYKKSK